MKTFLKHFFTLFFAIFLISLTSCFFDIPEEEEQVDAGTITFDFNASETPTNGGRVYAVLFNPTLTPLKNIRHISGATGVTGFNATPTHTEALYATPETKNFSNGGAFPQNIHFHPKDEIHELLRKNKGVRAASPTGKRAASEPPPSYLDNTTGEGLIYIDNYIDIATGEVRYVLEKVTRKYGDNTKKCNVWLADKE